MTLGAALEEQLGSSHCSRHTVVILRINCLDAPAKTQTPCTLTHIKKVNDCFGQFLVRAGRSLRAFCSWQLRP